MKISTLPLVFTVPVSAQYFNPSPYYAPPVYPEFAEFAAPALPVYTEYAPQAMYMQAPPPLVHTEYPQQLYNNFAPPVYTGYDYVMQQPMATQPSEIQTMELQPVVQPPQPETEVEEIIDPRSVEAEKQRYLAKAAENLREQIEAATRKNNEDKEAITKAAEERKKQYIESSDERLKNAVKDSDDKLAARVKALTQSADDYKERLDSQSMKLAMQYCQRTLKEEFDRAEKDIAAQEPANKRELEDELRLAQEVARTASQAMGETYGDSDWFPATVSRARRVYSEKTAAVRKAREANLEQYRTSLTDCARKSRESVHSEYVFLTTDTKTVTEEKTATRVVEKVIVREIVTEEKVEDEKPKADEN